MPRLNAVFSIPTVYRAEYGQARHEMGLVHAEEDRFVFFGIIATLALSYGLYLGVPLLWSVSIGKGAA
jgi:hypothetical protein